jgi:hypothetical protein
MRVDCISCGYEVNLDHKVFDDYSGPIKCYCCGAMMEMRTVQGVMHSLMSIPGRRPPRHTEQGPEAAAL